MKKGLIGIIICTLLITVAFLPISYAMNIENNELNATLSNNDLVTIPITVYEAWDLLTDTGNGIQIPIDIRPDEQWNEGFIDTPYPENAVHFSLDDIQENLDEFLNEYEGKEIIPYSTTYPGYHLLVLLTILCDANYTGTIYIMEGGFTAWEEAGLPIRNNTAPDAPYIDGPTSGKPGVEYEYVFSTTDPEGDDVSYYIEWGDGETTGWTDYFTSGEEAIFSHTWGKIDWDNTIRCKAKDIYDAESDWSITLVPINFLILRFLEQFPSSFPIPKQLLGL